MNFDYDGWISNHTNNEEYLKPYNGSIFALRDSYRQVFPEEDEFGEIDDDKESSKIFKISFRDSYTSLIFREIQGPSN